MRAQVVILRDGLILLAKHVAPDRTYWVLPGGEIEPGETPEEAAIREVREESGLDICIVRHLFVDEPRRSGAVSIHSPRHTFLAEVEGGELCPAAVPEAGHPEKGYLAGVEWMAFDAPELDEATRDTLRLVCDALSSNRP